MRVDPKQVCEVCRGTGKSYVEHPDGTLTEVVCGYCKGRKDSTWVEERFWAREYTEGTVKGLIVCYFVALVITNGLPFWSLAGDGPPAMFVLHCLAWFVGIAGLVWWFCNPAAKRKAKAAKHAPGFTEPREQIMGAVLMGGALLKHEWDRNHHHQAAFPPVPSAPQQQPMTFWQSVQNP